MAAPVSFRERSDSFPLHRSPRPYMGPISGSHQGPQPERLHLEAGYMAAPVSFRERSDSFPLHRGRRPYMALTAIRYGAQNFVAIGGTADITRLEAAGGSIENDPSAT